MSETVSIKCPRCAAPLNLFGGGRIQTVTCSYCNSVIDLNESHKVLSNFKNAPRPDVPFKLGMVGKLKGVEYTLIGLVQYETIQYAEVWTDFLLFSPLYGYAWLTYDEGHLIFSRRTRDVPNTLYSEIPYHKSMVVQEKSYEYMCAYDAKITYVEGELTWIAKKGERTSFMDLIHPPYGISVEKSTSEIEYYKSEYMSKDEVYDAFDIPKKEQPLASDFHMLKPFEKHILNPLSTIAMLVLIIMIFVFMGLNIDGKGETILSMKATNKAVTQKEFTLSSSKYLLELQLKTEGFIAGDSDIINNFNLKIQKGKERLFTLNKASGYTFASQSSIDDRLSSWEANSKEVLVYIKLKQTGIYTLTVTPVDSSKTTQMNITLKEQRVRNNYMIYFTIMALISFLLYYYYKIRYRQRLNEERDEEDSILGQNILTYVFWAMFIIFLIVMR